MKALAWMVLATLNASAQLASLDQTVRQMLTFVPLLRASMEHAVKIGITSLANAILALLAIVVN